MSTKTEVLERMGDLSNRVTITTGGTSVLLGWLTTEHVLSLVAAVCTVVGMLITWFYKREAAKRLSQEAVRRAEAHALELEARRLKLEEQRERIRLLRSGRWPLQRVNDELDQLDTDLGQLGVDE